MHENNTIIRISFLLCFLSSQPILGQIQSSLKYQDRGNRMEGLKEIWETSGAHIDFWGAFISSTNLPSIDSIKSVQLKFFLLDSTVKKVVVRDLSKKNYWMIPENKKWNKGWNIFEWPTNEVLQKIPIQLNELIPLDSAMMGRSTGDVIPFLLTGNALVPQRQTYTFIFQTSGETDLIIKWFKKINQYYKEIDSYDMKQSAKMPFPVERDFQSTDNEGHYRLQLRGMVKRGRNRVPVDLEYDFYHKPVE